MIKKVVETVEHSSYSSVVDSEKLNDLTSKAYVRYKIKIVESVFQSEMP